MAPVTPAGILKRHPGAAVLSVYDGMVAAGLVLDTRRQERASPAALSYAFTPDGRFVGAFGCRREATAALPRATR